MQQHRTATVTALILCLGVLLAMAPIAAAQTTPAELQIPDIPETDIRNVGAGADIDIDGPHVVVGMPNAQDPAVADFRGPFSSDVRTGVIAVYRDGATQATAVLRPPAAGTPGVFLSSFGNEVEVSGDRIVTTAVARDVPAYFSPVVGHFLLVFQRDGDDWVLASQTPLDPTSPDVLSQVALDGDILAVSRSIPGRRDDVAVFDLSGGAPAQMATLTPDDPDLDDFSDNLGDVAIDGDAIVIGADRASQAGLLGAGKAYLFRQTTDDDPAGWTQTAILTADDPEFLGGFGASVDVRDEQIAVGSGRYVAKAHLFTRAGVPVTTLLTPDVDAAGVFATVAVDGPHLILGVSGLDQDGQFLQSRVYQFDRPAGPQSWQLVGTLEDEFGDVSFQQSGSLALEGNRAVTGTGAGRGAVSLFTLE